MNPYKILGITEQATDDDVKRAYRAMAAKYHPDAGGDAWVFEQVREAYDRIVRGRQPTAKPPNPTRPTQPAATPPPAPVTKPVYQPSADRRSGAWPSRMQRLYWSLFHHQLPLQSETSFFILFNVLDIVFTNILLRMHAIEANPLANSVLIRWGFNGMIAFKLLLVAGVCLITQLIAVHHLQRARQTLYLGSLIVGIVVAYSGFLLLRG
jgi:hypothetical protein